MTEEIFRKKNRDRWDDTEKKLRQRRSGIGSAREFVRIYTELSDDLAYTRAHFPGSVSDQYLNGLLSRVHERVNQAEIPEKGRFKKFWTTDLPQLWFKHRQYLLYSFLIFTAAILIGIFSSIQDPQFTRVILGDQYVDMTLENIDKDDPMAVYKKMDQSEMFIAITVNNIRVSFLAFAGGIFAGLGTLFVLFQNGVMLGTFQHFFHDFDLLFETILVIWIHGTIEIAAIILAGASGLVMGSGLLFPGQSSRLQAFRSRAIDGSRMVAGLVPFFVIAGALESWITRITTMPVWLSLFIILGSLALVVWYFIIYPSKLAASLTAEPHQSEPASFQPELQ
ncbi:MAG: stage II sporulation protein M [Balneolales bacterium]|nr:stage II sporulation protein M [Balneolales bacterium]